MVDWAGFERMNRLLHFVESVRIEIKVREVEPGSGSRVASGNGGPILSFGCGRVLVFFINARQQPVSPRLVERHKGICLRARFVFPTAYHPRCFRVELSKIGPRLRAFGIQFHRPLKRQSYFLGKSRCRENSRAVGLLAVGSSEPEMVDALLRRKTYRMFARRDRVVPFVHHEIGAAKQIVQLSLARIMLYLLFKPNDRFIDMTRSEKLLRGLRSIYRLQGQEKQQEQK